MSVEVRRPFTRMAAQRPFDRKVGQQTEEIVMQRVNQIPNRLRQPNVLPFSASWRCYPGNRGLRVLGAAPKMTEDTYMTEPMLADTAQSTPTLQGPWY